VQLGRNCFSFDAPIKQLNGEVCVEANWLASGMKSTF